jgi:beta-lactamase superfamily II metal-dependent hydrolase
VTVSRSLRIILASGATALASLVPLTLTPSAGAVMPNASPCSTSGTWRPGELNVYWFDVEQGDGQLIVGPTGKTMLIDLGETAWNSTGANTNATRIAGEIRAICGTGSNPVHLDYVMASHHHLDHIGYAGVPDDGGAYGNGIYQLLSPTSTGGLGFTVGQLIDHDGGTWTDANGDGKCNVGTSTAPAPEIAWHNVGTLSQTSRRWICWLYGPAAQADRAAIDGKVLTLKNTDPSWPSFDLGGGATAAVVNANGKGTMQADGVTPVSGDHSADAVPPSENDYSVAVKVTYGSYKYATAGDSDGEYNTSANGYTYNNIEASLPAKFGNLNFDTVRANHHGSGHSSSDAYVNAMDPETTLISCGVNNYGHPANRTLNAYRTVGADIYLTNNPCDTTDTSGAAIDYSGTLNHNGTVHLYTTNAGADYSVDYDAGTKSYVTGGGGGGGGTQGDPTQIKVNEFMMAPNPGNEWIELYNPTATSVDVSGYFIDDVANGGGAPKQIPAGTVIPAGGRWVYEFASGYLNNTGTDAARYTSPGGVEIDAYTYSLGSTQYNKVFHRTGDGGAWCGTISANVTKGTANPATCP